MKTVPYLYIRLAAGAVAALVSIFEIVTEGGVLAATAGLVAFVVGWLVARRFGRPPTTPDERPWLDTALPIAIAAFAIAPAVATPLIGQIAIGPTAAVFVLFFAGVALSLGLGPYANVKVALVR